MIEVLAPGLLTTVQDGGRVGHATLGVGRAGAMDEVALRLANILVGNVESAATLEITLRGPRLRLAADALIAFAGAPLDAVCDGVALPAWRPLALRAGSEIVCGGMRSGARSYLAVAGGIQTPPLLGSRSVDLNAGIGRALAPGDALACTTVARSRARSLWRDLERSGAACRAARWSLDAAPWSDTAGEPVAVLRGAHFDALDAASRRALFGGTFRVAVDSNRVGYRLDGTRLALHAPRELVSEGVVPGTVQLPPSGQPIALMAEAPTTGGYPRVAAVAAIDLPRLAQRRPADAVRFVEISLDEAQTRYLARERALAALAARVAERLHD